MMDKFCNEALRNIAFVQRRKTQKQTKNCFTRCDINNQRIRLRSKRPVSNAENYRHEKEQSPLPNFKSRFSHKLNEDDSKKNIRALQEIVAQNFILEGTR